MEENESDLRGRLLAAWDIVNGVWWIVTPNAAQLPDTDKASGTLWHRHDPQVVFERGWQHPENIYIDRPELNSYIADYFSKPYLRHPYLDWIFLDIGIYAEITGFGESIKQKVLPFKRSAEGENISYSVAKGNLAEMQRIERASSRSFRVTWILIALVVGCVCARQPFENFGALIGLMVCVVVVLGLLAQAFWMLLIRIVRRLRNQTEPTAKYLEIWQSMYSVWHMLAPRCLTLIKFAKQ